MIISDFLLIPGEQFVFTEVDAPYADVLLYLIPKSNMLPSNAATMYNLRCSWRRCRYAYKIAATIRMLKLSAGKATGTRPAN